MNYAGDLGSMLMPMRDHVLEKLRYAATQHITREALMDGEGNAMMHFATNTVVMQVRAAVWAEKLDEGKNQYPATWWDHLKQRWFPKWALARWPVRFVEFNWKVYRTYPDYLHISKSPRIVVHSVVATPARLLP